MAKHVAETNVVEVPHRTAVALERYLGCVERFW